jgi:hypothetical protein
MGFCSFLRKHDANRHVIPVVIYGIVDSDVT